MYTNINIITGEGRIRQIFDFFVKNGGESLQVTEDAVFFFYHSHLSFNQLPIDSFPIKFISFFNEILPPEERENDVLRTIFRKIDARRTGMSLQTPFYRIRFISLYI